MASFYYDNGDKFWYLPSKGRTHWHRLDGPAVEYIDGSSQWWVDGKLHRIDGPACIYIDTGIKEWWVNGKRHRLDGPAIEWATGSKGWYVNGEPHRLDGPAAEYANGDKEWWIDGKQLDLKEVKDWLEKNSIDLSSERGQMCFKLRFS